MDSLNTAMRMLDLMDRPGFIASKGNILYVNTHAAALNIHKDSSLESLLGEHKRVYDTFTAGSLQLLIHTQPQHLPATVEKLDGFDLFIIEDSRADAQLTALAMASVQLQIPLTGLMNTMDQSNPQANRMLYQLHRAVRNMYDALRYCGDRTPQLQVFEMNSWLSEITESVAAHTQALGLTVTFKPHEIPLHCPIDEELLRRAVLNLISNSIKSGSTVLKLSLTKQPKTISITLSDNGKGAAQDVRAEIFCQYRRRPSIQDSDYGLGLGMVIAKAAATAHKGALLLEHKKDGGLRATLTISTQQETSLLRAPIMRMDYLGGRDPVLTELSDVLPNSEY